MGSKNAPSQVSSFLDSMVDELGADGSLPDVVPYQRFGGRPADLSWSAAFLENLWTIWKSESWKASLLSYLVLARAGSSSLVDPQGW